jgi:tRNA pseudouridine38-40 synthase
VKNICLILEYDGTDFNGFQKQPNKSLRTIQGELEKAIFKITGNEINITGAGRTDSGVSASQQYANFYTDVNIPPEKFCFALNTKLPPEISVINSFEVPIDFNARYSAIRRTYRYKILNSKIRSALRRNSVYHYRAPLDYEVMQEAWLSLRGKHDFSAFCKSDHDRTYMSCEIFNTESNRSGNELIFFITSDTFLRGMVRFLIGTLILIGEHELNPGDLMELVRSRDRNRVTFSASGVGLSLVKIEYPEEAFIFNKKD